MTESDTARRRRVARGDLPDRCLRYLTTHPGSHRANAVAKGLGVPGDHTGESWGLAVAKTLGRLHRNGECDRQDLDIGWTRPVGHYTAKGGTT